MQYFRIELNQSEQFNPKLMSLAFFYDLVKGIIFLK